MGKTINDTFSITQINDRNVHAHLRSSSISMAELKPGQQGIVIEIPATDLLPELSIRVGKQISIIARSLAGGPILVRVDNRSIAIDLEIAREILIDPGK